MGTVEGQVIVIGAGIGGLSTAIALRQAGLNVSVYEQAPKLGEVGAGITLWPNAIRALRRIGLADQVIAAGYTVKTATMLAQTGRTLSLAHSDKIEKALGEPTVAIHRAELHRILSSGLPTETVHLGATCAGIEQSDREVTARFTDGQTARGGLLVGADGIHSVVRQQLFPDIRLRYAGYTAWRGVAAAQDNIAEGASETFGRGSRFGKVPVGQKRIYWYATANSPGGQILTGSARKADILERFKGWHEPIERLIQATPDDSILQNDIFDIKPMKRWSTGLAVLLGDAAHPTTPNMGQGACMAIESGIVLGNCLAQEQDLAAALRRYQAERMSRTAWITDQSWNVGRIGQLEGRLACLARDLMFSLTPEFLIRRQLTKATNFRL